MFIFIATSSLEQVILIVHGGSYEEVSFPTDIRKRRPPEGKRLVDARTDGSAVGPPARVLERQQRRTGCSGGVRESLAGDMAGDPCPQQVELEETVTELRACRQ